MVVYIVLRRHIYFVLVSDALSSYWMRCTCMIILEVGGLVMGDSGGWGFTHGLL